ncbi:MAG: SpoIIE family protein phosphatase [Blastococcus sp.]
MSAERPESEAAEITRLRHELADLQQAVNAIRDGEVDAVVVGGAQGEQLYTQISADRPYRVIVEEMGDGALTVSERGIVLYANDRMAQLLGRERRRLLGADVTELVGPEVRPVLAELLTARPGTTRRSELDLLAADDVLVPVLASVTGLEIDDVVVRCLIVADLTDQRRGEQVLAEANAGLSRSTRELEEAQRIGGIGSWYWDAVTDAVEWSPQMFPIFGVDPRATGLTFRAALAATSHPDDVPVAIAARERALADRQPFTLEQRVVHPNGEIRYTVTRSEVICGEDGDVIGMRGTTQDITEQRLAAAAVDDARQQLLRKKLELEEEHRVKETLQRAVLPARLPDAPGFRLAARYLPADRPALVGGDWYDAFMLPDGTVALAVGDVAGHDLDAAATMGQMRNALRAYAFADGPPGSVLALLNRLADGLADSGLATAVFGRLDAGDGSFRWACAGHPPPLVIGAEGARLLPPPVGMMLGADADAPFTDAVVPLRAGDRLVLYSDGLIERRNSDLDADFAALLRAADDLCGRSPEEICAVLLDRLVPAGAHEDDVCLLAVEWLG